MDVPRSVLGAGRHDWTSNPKIRHLLATVHKSWFEAGDNCVTGLFPIYTTIPSVRIFPSYIAPLADLHHHSR